MMETCIKIFSFESNRQENIKLKTYLKKGNDKDKKINYYLTKMIRNQQNNKLNVQI